MPYQVLFSRLSFQRTKLDEPTIPVGEPVVVVRGDLVPEWVSSFEVNALSNAGMVGPVDRPNPEIIPVEAVPVQPRTPDQPIVLPSDPNGVPPVVAGQGDTGEDVPDVEPVQPVKPSRTDSKEKWENYATSPAVGMTLGEAEALTKTKLIDQIDEIERRKQGQTPEPAL